MCSYSSSPGSTNRKSLAMSVRQGLHARLVRVFGFFRKELISVFRQPRLVLTLIVGPFLILLIFGLGYRNTQPPFRTLLVLGGEDAQLAADAQDLGDSFGGGILLEGTTTDLTAARARLDAGEIDLLIVAPDDPLAAFDSGEQAEFEVIHGEMDPVIRSSIELMAELSVNEINRRVLAQVIEGAQQESEEVEDPVASLEASSANLVSALEEGDTGGAEDQLEILRAELSKAQTQAQGATSLYTAVAAALGTGFDEAFGALDSKLEVAGSGDDEAALAAAREVEESISQLETQITRAQQLDPSLLVRPFGVDVVEVNEVTAEVGAFYSPGTLAVLLQHLAVTFATLSLVRERQLGLTDVFRASPLSPGEALTGKYLGFGTVALGVAAGLSAVMLFFGVQFRGSVLQYSEIIVLLVGASLGLGFVLSALSQTDTQAVQYSMIVLLVSIFFTGFVLPLRQLATPVQMISYLIPATYGIQALHDSLFRGARIDPMILAGLFLYALAMAVASWFVVRREVRLIRT